MEDSRQPQLLQLLLQSRRQTRVHAATTAQHDSLVQTGAHIDIGALDGVEEQFGDTGLVDVDQMRLEETLGGLEALATDADDATVGEGVGFHQDGGVLGELLVQLQVVGDVAELLLDLAHRFEVGRPVQGVTAAQQQRDQVTGDIATGHVQPADVVVQDGGFVDGDDVGDTVTGVDDHSAAEA